MLTKHGDVETALKYVASWTPAPAYWTPTPALQKTASAIGKSKVLEKIKEHEGVYVTPSDLAAVVEKKLEPLELGALEHEYGTLGNAVVQLQAAYEKAKTAET